MVGKEGEEKSSKFLEPFFAPSLETHTMTTTTTTPAPAVKPTLVKAEKFLEVANKLSLPVLEQSGFFKVSGPKGHHLYVAKNANGVRRIDVSGWKLDDSLLGPGVGAFGNVTGQLNLSGTEEEQLARFELAAADMQAQKEKVPARKTPPQPTAQAVSAPRPTPPSAELVSSAQIDPALQTDSSVIA